MTRGLIFYAFAVGLICGYVMGASDARADTLYTGAASIHVGKSSKIQNHNLLALHDESTGIMV